jgi:hypothetical protein
MPQPAVTESAIRILIRHSKYLFIFFNKKRKPVSVKT